MTTCFNPLDHPILFTAPRRLTQYSTWHGHIPFAMLLVELARPKLIVELGTYYGDSYCAFCQAVQELRLPTQCFAIDTWRGDIHMGTYGDEVLAHLCGHHDPLYAGFSQLLQSTFDDAQPRFANGSIDILHIDGYHTYEIVKHDFECWLPKMSPRGLVLLHDTQARLDGYGAWIFWDEIKTRHPSLEFLHGYGLGVLAVGKEPPPAVLELMTASTNELVKLRNLCSHLGSALSQKAVLDRLNSQLSESNAAAATLAQQMTEKEHSAGTEQSVAALQQTVTEQTEHLDALTARIDFLTSREAELRALLRDAHEQLKRRDDEILGTRPTAGPMIRAPVDKFAWLEGRIRWMEATRVWRLGMLYWRAHAWLTRHAAKRQ